VSNRFLGGILLASCAAWCLCDSSASAQIRDAKVQKSIDRGLDWLANHQSRLGHWAANGNQYPTAMTALAGNALLAEGSTTTQGKHCDSIRRAVDYLVSRSRTNGLIGEPTTDNRYTYGHGFSMLFLSQVLGEEEDEDRRVVLVDVLSRAVQFCGRAQTTSGGWGYVSARDGNDFDEGSTTITQVQGLRACRNAGIPVAKDVIERAIKYIKDCTLPDGGVRYSSKSGGGARPAITAAAISCLFNAGDYDSEFVPRLLKFCRNSNELTVNSGGSGHWHYAHYYYAQVLYREGGDEWESYRDQVNRKLMSEQSEDGSWRQGYVGTVYTTATNLTIMQLENANLPIYQP